MQNFGLFLIFVYLAIFTYDSSTNNQAALNATIYGIGQKMPDDMYQKLCGINTTKMHHKDQFCRNNVDVDKMCAVTCAIIKVAHRRCATIDNPQLSICGCTGDPNNNPEDRTKYWWITTDTKTQQNQTCGNGLKVVNMDF